VQNVKSKLIGIIPARMAASRFPGKPLEKILGMPMVEHVFHRAKLFPEWDQLLLTTCDDEIREFADSAGIPVVMTSPNHTRALDRVAEAANHLDSKIAEDDIIVNVQGDEPMLRPDMFEIIRQTFDKPQTNIVFLAVDIVDEDQYYDPNILKIVHDLSDRAIYTSRTPVPYSRKFNKGVGAKRIFGIFAFRWKSLKQFTALPESPLEKKEACDINRLFDHGHKVNIARYPHTYAFSVDSPEDLDKVKKYMAHDPLFGTY